MCECVYGVHVCVAWCDVCVCVWCACVCVYGVRVCVYGVVCVWCACVCCVVCVRACVRVWGVGYFLIRGTLMGSIEEIQNLGNITISVMPCGHFPTCCCVYVVLNRQVPCDGPTAVKRATKYPQKNLNIVKGKNFGVGGVQQFTVLLRD